MTVHPLSPRHLAPVPAGPIASIDLRAILATGNLVGAARSGDRRDWRMSAALGLIGAGNAALDGLAATDDPDARLLHAICLWIDGQDGAAEAMLREAPASPGATRLRTLLESERIRVLCYLAASRNGPHGMFGAVGRDPRFDVRCVWFGAGKDGVDNRPGASIQHFYPAAAKPDLLICEMVEWHVLPRDLAEAPFLKVGHTSDFDIHGPEVLPWLRLFDVVLTLDHTEWTKLRPALAPLPVMNYPKVFTVRPKDLGKPGPRPIDVLMTGTVHSDYHHDKNELIARLKGIPGLNCVLLNGFVGGPEYERLTRQAKLTLSYVRHSGTMPTRALESLALGTWSLVQDDAALRLYLPEDAALVPYRFGNWDRFAADIRTFVDSYDDRATNYAERARATRALIAEAFAPERVASQYLRFCAALPALAAAIGLPLQAKARRMARPPMKRGCVTKGWLPAGGDGAVLRSLMDINCRIAETEAGWHGFNDSGRERLIEYARLSSRGTAEVELLEAAMESFAAAIETDPRALAPRFNLLRAGFHFGGAARRNEAVAMAQATLRLHADDKLTLAADDDLLPYDFFPSHFHAQAACDLRFNPDGVDLERIKALVVASIHYYLARSLNVDPAADGHYRKAIELDPDHVHFQVGHCEYLLATGGAQRETALARLKEIARFRMWTPLLNAMIEQLDGHPFDGGTDQPMSRTLYFDIEDELARDRPNRLARCHDMSGELYFGGARLRSRSPRLALVLCGAGISAADHRKTLTNLREAVQDIEIVLIDTALDVRASAISGIVDILLTAPTPGAVAYSSKAIAEVMRTVRAPYVLIAQPDSSTPETLIAWVARSFRVPQRNGSRGLDSERPLIVMCDDPDREPARNILCVGAKTALLRDSGLPQRVGMLQGPQLALPLLVQQLRRIVDSFRVLDFDFGRLGDEPSTSAALDIGVFVTRFEEETLRTLSSDWRRFEADQPSGRRGARMQLTIEPAAVPEIPSWRAPKPGDATAGEADTPAERYQIVLEFDRTSWVYRTAWRVHGRMRGAVRSTTDDGVAFDVGFLRFEHIYPGLRVRIPIARVIARILAARAAARGRRAAK